jgi:hypothetical protein
VEGKENWNGLGMSMGGASVTIVHSLLTLFHPRKVMKFQRQTMLQAVQKYWLFVEWTLT